MAKPFDVSKFRKDITKSIDGLSIGFHDPTEEIDEPPQPITPDFAMALSLKQ